MKRSAFLLAVLLCYTTATAGDAPKRPRILGIAEVRLFSTNAGAARSFYTQVFGSKEISPNTFSLNPRQAVAVFAVPSPVPSNLLAEVVFETDNLRELHKYFTAQRIQFTPKLTTGFLFADVFGPGYSALSMIDPEGHRISFIQYKLPLKSHRNEGQTRSHIIHVGFVVNDRVATDHFYKDILGFHLYWQGGRKDDETDWVNMQVPDGTDWIEYMLNVPANADHHTLGVMNHIALGVPDIKAAKEQLIKNGWKPGEEPKIGRGGKWQLNLYNPDDTRVELMEFTPVQKPCCSEYTGPHPKP